MADFTSPEVWGPTAWYLIHHITRNLVKTNPQDKQKLIYQNAVEEFFNSLLVVIPCEICQNHYREKLREDSFYQHIDKWKDLDQWGHQLHNRVNQMLKKPTLSYPNYLKMYAGKPTNKKLAQFPTIIFDLHLEPNMSISEIQDLKTFLSALVVLYPLGKKRDTQKMREDIKKIYDYRGLANYYQKLQRTLF